MASVLLMSPKWGLGFGVGGMTTSNEYGSKKSVEWTLKKTAVISIIVFTICALLYPYANKSHTVSNISVEKQTNLKATDIKVEGKNTDALKITPAQTQESQTTTGN